MPISTPPSPSAGRRGRRAAPSRRVRRRGHHLRRPRGATEDVMFVWKPDSCQPASARARFVGTPRGSPTGRGVAVRSARQLLSLAAAEGGRKPQHRALHDEVDRLQVVDLRQRANGRLVLRRNRGQRVAGLDDIRGRGGGRGRAPSCVLLRPRTPSGLPGRRPRPPRARASAGTWSPPPWSTRRSGRRRRAA